MSTTMFLLRKAFVSCTGALLLLLSLVGGNARAMALSLQQPQQDSSCCDLVSRRSSLATLRSAVVGLAASSSLVLSPQAAVADEQKNRLEARSRLLDSIQTMQKDDVILDAIRKLVPLDPCKGRGATKDQDLEGEWRLLWSAKNTASPLLKLPHPFKPESYQYLGAAAASEVGPGRVAQGLTGGFLGRKQLWLSSGVVPSTSDPSVLIIQPPFRFEVGSRYPTGGSPKLLLVEAGSDAEFRQVNLRNEEAQRAPLNLYQQMYLEQEGKGSLRISSIIDGDPVIVGDILVHVKL